MLVAVALASRIQSGSNCQPVPNRLVRPLALVTVLLVAGYWLAFYRPAISAEHALAKARTALAHLGSQSADTATLLTIASDQALASARINPFNSQGLYLAAMIEIHRWQQAGQIEHLGRAEAYCRQARLRDPEHYRYDTLLADGYQQAAAALPNNPDLAGKAISYLKAALQRNPIRSDLMVKLAQLDEAVNRTASAAELYRRALHTEALYQAQQRQMHGPNTSVVPRLAEKDRESAREGLRRLGKWVDF